MVLRTAYQNSGREDEDSAEDDLEDGGEEWRIHVTFADPGDGDKFDGHDDHGGGSQSQDT